MTLAATNLPDDARCRVCGYALRELTTPRCPECGVPFDPTDPHSYRRPLNVESARRRAKRARQRIRTSLNRFGTATVLLAIGLFVISLAEWCRGDNPTIASVYTHLLWIVILARLIIGPARRSRRPGIRAWRAMTIALLALALMFTNRPYVTCPHGTTIMFGHVGFAISDTGPCYNRMPNRLAFHVAGRLYLLLN